ncbi:MAG: hydrolase TatD, partial [Bacteroidetes bacterium]|nr:hydrolase TatD [Bacteroidota bacterium]
VPKTAALMLERGIPREHVEQTCYYNALAAYGQSGQMKESDWLQAEAVDQRQKFSGNSVLRGGQEPKIENDTSKPVPN